MALLELKKEYKDYTSKQYLSELRGIQNKLDAARQGLMNGVQGLPVDISLSEMVASQYGLGLNDYITKLGIDTSRDTLNLIFTMPDQSIRWVVPEIIRSAVTLGLRQAPFYPELIAADQPIKGLQAILPYVNMSEAQPSRVNEAETIPLGTISYGQKSVNIFKIGKGIKITDEVKNYVSIDVMAIYLRDFGVQLGYALDNLAVDTLLNGDMMDGSESAPVIGVQDPAAGIQYRDFLKLWVRGSRMGRNFTDMVAGEDIAIDVLDLPEFKDRYSGTTQATLNLKTPVPNSANFYINGGIPEDQILLLDKRAAMIKLTAQPLMLESERIVSNQTEAMYASLTTGFSKMYRDASILIDQTLAFSANGFPSYMDVDGQFNFKIEK